MAEERLIDDDKDKKYKIRKNADGEDELYIDDTEEETVSDEPVVIAEQIEPIHEEQPKSEDPSHSEYHQLYKRYTRHFTDKSLSRLRTRKGRS